MNKKKSVYFRWLLSNSTAWNYEKYQGLGYASAMIPSLKEIYKDDPEALHKSIEAHMQFFNTNATTGSVILGATLAMEEEAGIEAIEAVSGLKTGLMGALAGIGDTLFVVLPGSIIGAIASYMALSGSWYGVLLFPAFFMFKNILVYYLISLGYEQGTALVTTMGDKLKNITTSANVLGIMVVGGLIPSVVRATSSVVITTGEVTNNLQDTFDMIMPGLLPALIVGLTYYLLGLEKLNSTKVIFILMGLGIVLHMVGFLA